jgi:hypothetical protein
MFSYVSCLWMAQATGIEGSMLPLCNNTACRLCLQESMNSHHSSRLYLMFIAAIIPSMFLQALSSPCVMNNCSESFLQEQNAITFTVSPRRFHCWSLEDNNSALFFDTSRSQMRLANSLCMILCGSTEIMFRKTSGFLQVDGCCVSLDAFSHPSSQCREKLSGVLE